MPRQKRTASRVIQIAAARAAGLESIDPKLNLGSEMTLAGYRGAIAEALEKQAAYNTLLAQGDEAKNLFESAETKTRDFSDRMLAAVAAKFGRASNEYEQAGGRRKTGRRRPVARTEVIEAKAA